MSKPLWMLAASLLLMSQGCEETASEPTPEPVSLRLTIENISAAQTFVGADGQPVTLALAPGVFFVTSDSAKIFAKGQVASKPLEVLAETGSPVELLALHQGAYVSQSGIIGDVNNPDYKESPLLPGGRAGFVVELDALPSDARLVLAMMLGPSNDTFLGTPDGGILLDELEPGEQTTILQWWDAGTEVNEPLGVGEHQVSRAPGTETGQEQGEALQAAQLMDEQGAALLPPVSQVVRLTIERL
jgi:hypothetical protein